ncbi:hypothetical protein GCM10008013_18030 [Paenibacillus segetis]|uniref:Uncharacterized protein n=1 Tax=Paenibacillus segetis TaxID=1325360 RepID=A0ABQ1YCX2_9BACL|nr:hypothetical protein GCM10008013_18030 [Paenibacillus segetis]
MTDLNDNLTELIIWGWSLIRSTTMKERVNFHALWCIAEDAWMANGQISAIRKRGGIFC